MSGGPWALAGGGPGQEGFHEVPDPAHQPFRRSVLPNLLAVLGLDEGIRDPSGIRRGEASAGGVAQAPEGHDPEVGSAQVDTERKGGGGVRGAVVHVEDIRRTPLVMSSSGIAAGGPRSEPRPVNGAHPPSFPELLLAFFLGTFHLS